MDTITSFRKTWWRGLLLGLVVFFATIQGSLSVSSVSAEPNQSLLDGTVIYTWTEEEYRTTDVYETGIMLECTEKIIIESVSSKIMRFTKTLELEIIYAYLSLHSGVYADSTGDIQWIYLNETGNTYVDETNTFYGDTHTITIIQEIDRETGLLISVESHASGIDAIKVNRNVWYTYEEIPKKQSLGFTIFFGEEWTHTNLYCEEASDLGLGDTWIWGKGEYEDLIDVFVSFSEFRGRETIILEPDRPWIGLTLQREFDRETGLLVRENIRSEYDTYGGSSDSDVVVEIKNDYRFEENLMFQDVFPDEITTSEPSTITTTETIVRTITSEPEITTTEFFESPFTTQMGATTPDPVSDTPASFIPGFGPLMVIFGLVVLLWVSRRRTK